MNAQCATKEHQSSGPTTLGAAKYGNSSVMLYCEPCQYVDTSSKREYKGFCIECTEYLCRECIRDHRKNKITRQHVVLQEDKIPKDISPFIQMKEMTKCESHPDRMVDFECVDHNKLICSLCLSRHHRDCSNLNDLSANEKGIHLDIESVSVSIEVVSKTIKSIIDQREQYSIDLEHNREEINRICDEYVQYVKAQIDRINNEVKSKAAIVVMSENRSIAKSITECTQFIQKMEQLQQLLKISHLYGKDFEKAAALKYLTEQTKHLYTSIQHVQKKKFNECHVSPETTLASLQSLCKVTSKCSDDLLMPNPSPTQSNPSDTLSKDEKTLEDTAHKAISTIQSTGLHTDYDTKAIANPSPTQSNPSDTLSKDGKTLEDTAHKVISSIQSTGVHTVYDTKDQTEFPSINKNANMNQSINTAPNERCTSRTPMTTMLPAPTKSVVSTCATPKSVQFSTYNSVAIRAQDDAYSPSIVACANLPGSRMAILDAANNKVKLLSVENEICFYVSFKLPGRPSDMCAFITESQKSFLYVCFPELKQIQKIAVMAKRQNSVVETIQTNFHPISLTSVGSRIIVLSKSSLLSNYTTTFGLEQLQVDHGNVQRILEGRHAEFASRIRFLNKTSIMCIRHKSVTCVQIGIKDGAIYVVGELWRSVDTDQVRSITDIAVVNENVVYVCGCDSNNVKSLGSDGRWGSGSIVDCVNKPGALLYDNRKSRIIVGSYNKDKLGVSRAS